MTWLMSPFINDLDRAESEWLLAREVDPSAPAPSSEIAADYAEIEDLLATLSSGSYDESWHEDVLRAISAATLPSQPWWRMTVSRWVMSGALAMAAAVIVWLLLPRGPELEVVVRHIGITRSAPGEVVVGDHLVVTARPHGAGDLRIYRSDDGKLVARCPNGPGCRGGSHGAQTIDIRLDAPVPYQVILVDGVTEALPDGDMDGYLRAASAANADVIRYPPIDVH